MQQQKLNLGLALTITAVLLVIIAVPFIYRGGISGKAVLLQPQAPSVAVGNSVTVNVSTDGITNLSGIQFSVAYDPNVLRLDSVDQGTFLDENGASSTFFDNGSNSTAGERNDIVIVRLENTGVSGAGTLALLHFTAVQAGTASVNFTKVLLSDNNSNQINTNYVNTSVSVTSNDKTPPVVSMDQPPNGIVVSGNQEFNATATDNVGVTKVEFLVDGTIIATDATVPYGITWDTSTVLDGSHTLTVKAFDAGGNQANATRTVTVDNTPPTVSVSSPVSGAQLSGMATFTASATDASGVKSVQFLVDGVPVGTDTTAPYSIIWNTSGASNGWHDITAKATDQLNNVGTSGPVSVNISNTVVDNTPPTITLTTPANGATVSGSVGITASASDNVGVKDVTFSVDGIDIATDNNSPYATSWNSGTVTNGNHLIVATATDLAGNNASKNVTVNVSNTGVDTTKPSIFFTSPANGADVSGTVTLTASATDNVGVTSVVFKVAGKQVGSTLTSAPYTVQWDSSTVGYGSYGVTATASDAAGNTATASISLVKPSPNTGSSGGGGGGGGGAYVPPPTTTSSSGSTSTTTTTTQPPTVVLYSGTGSEDLSSARVQLNTNINDTSLQVTYDTSGDLPAMPSGVDAYRRVSILPQGFTYTNIDSAIVRFKVPRSWLDAQSLNASAVSLYVLQNGQWQPLSTAIENQDQNNVYYTVKNAQIGVLTIGGQTAVQQNATPTTAPSQTEAPTTIPTQKKGMAWQTLLELAIGLVGLLVLGTYFMGRRYQHAKAEIAKAPKNALGSYVQQTRNEGFTDDQIRTALSQKGWPKEKIDDAMKR